MLDAIGEVRCITGVSGIDYISNPDIQARRDSIGDVGYEGNINYELLLSLYPYQDTGFVLQRAVHLSAWSYFFSPSLPFSP